MPDKEKYALLVGIINDKMEHYTCWKEHFENISWKDYKPYMKEVIENHKISINLLEYLQYKIKQIG